jgi:anti-sigma factor RsiW
VVRRELSKAEVERLFVGAVDDALPDRDAVQLNAGLDADPSLKTDYQRYARAVALLRRQPKEPAPPGLAGLVLRRVRRRRGAARRLAQQADYRLPAEIIVPLMLAVLVALFMVVAGQ